jgi:hypothetical protein
VDCKSPSAVMTVVSSSFGLCFVIHRRDYPWCCGLEYAYVLKMETGDLSENLVPVCQIIRCHVSEDQT